jgi:predicted ATPase
MATTGSPTFGDLLRRYRVLACLTQEVLAERAHLSTRAIKSLEQGINRAPRAATLALLVEAMALSPEARATLVAAAQQDTHTAREGAERSASIGDTAPLLVGRAQELALLSEHLAGVGPPVLLLAGEPGIGKSRLLRHAAEQAPAAGWQVLVGGCQRRGGQEPYAPLLQALAAALAGRTHTELRAMLRGCAWMVRLLPELANGPIEPLPAWSMSPEQERRLMIGAVERLLANVAGPAGTLLVLDDLQWAGTDALDLLATLARTGAGKLRVLGAYRDTEIHPHDPLTGALADLAQASLVRHHVVPPLAPAEVRQLLDAILIGEPGDGAALAARVAQRTGGVPFFVVSCALALRADARAGREAIPWDVTQGIRQRVAALPAVAQEVLGVAAIAVGRTVQAPVLAAVLEQSERSVLAGLEVAGQTRLLEDVEGGYRIAHDLIREVLEADLGSARRAMLHRRTAEALEARYGGATAEVLAYHYGRSDVPERAVGYLEQAGDQARAQYGRAAAEGFYREGVEWLDRLGRPLDAARVREKLGRLLHTGARYAEALAVLEPAAAACRAAGDYEATGRVEAEISFTHNDRGTAAEGLARLESVLVLLAERGPSRALAALYSQQADHLHMLGRLREDLAATEQAERIARLVGDDEHLGEALQLRGTALLLMGRVAEAIRALSAAVTVTEAAGYHYRLCAALWVLAYAHQEVGAFTAGRQAAEHSLQLAERHGFRTQATMTVMRRGWIAFLSGEWGVARRDFEQAITMGREVGPFWGSVFGPLGLAALCLAEGAQAEAEQHLEECERLLHAGLAANAGLRIVGQRVSCVLAERDLLAGQPGQARARLAAVLDPGTPLEEDVTPSLPLMAWALHDLGEVDEAAEAAWQAVACAREQGRQVLLVDALRVAAMVAGRQGRWEKAESALAEGLLLARHLSYPYGEARLLLVSSESHIHQGQPESAREHLEAARAIFGRLGASKDLERAE